MQKTRKIGSGLVRTPQDAPNPLLRSWDWMQICHAGWTPATFGIIARLLELNNEPMPATDVPCFSRVMQINGIMIKHKLPYRLRLLGGRSKPSDDRPWYEGRSLQIRRVIL